MALLQDGGEVELEMESSVAYAALEEVVEKEEESPAAPSLARSNSSSSLERSCRICMEGTESGRLISPCECSGSVSLIHTRCLEQWLEHRTGGASNLKRVLL